MSRYLSFLLPVVVCFLFFYPLFTEASNEVNLDMNELQCGINTSIATVITSFTSSQAKECLNVTENETAPIPVVLESTITATRFICENRTPVYAFYCTVHGNDLIWDFNNERITGFVPSDSVGRTSVSVISYNDSEPVYNVTARLTHVSLKSKDTPIPLCISILTVHPFNESQSQPKVMPFTVSCRSYCQPQQEGNDTVNDIVCQPKHYEVAATPFKPREVMEVMGNITSTPEVGGSVASVNWLPPENFDKTNIDHYELNVVLIQNGSNTNSTTFRIDSAASLPYYFKVSEGNYTVSVTAVDACGQRSEPSEPVSINVTSRSLPDSTLAKQEQLKDKVIGLAVPFSIALAIIVILIIIVIVLKRNSIREKMYNIAKKIGKNSTNDDSKPKA